MSSRAWDILFIAAAILCALVSARFYVVAVLDKDRLLSRAAAGAFVAFGVAALVYWWGVV